VIVVLLPGMDGTGILFKDFVGLLPDGVTAEVVSYPQDSWLSYEQLASRVKEIVPRCVPYLVLAESYSGPVAALLAAQPIGNLTAVVFVSSFVAFPCGRLGPWIAKFPADRWLRRLPAWIFRWFLLDTATSPQKIREIQHVISGVRPGVLGRRLRDALTANFTDTMQKTTVRIVCLQGTHDRVLGMRGVRGLLSARRDSEIAKVVGPHFLLQCSPRESLTALREMKLFD